MAKKAIPLPDGIVESDTDYPSGTGKDKIDYSLGNGGTLLFYYTERFGWCLTTLPIGGRRTPFPERYYAITVKDQVGVRVGGGPHVTSTLTIYLRKGNKVHQKYHGLYISGAGKAGDIRDRIGSRRAQGQEMRAQGRTSWRWDV